MTLVPTNFWYQLHVTLTTLLVSVNWYQILVPVSGQSGIPLSKRRLPPAVTIKSSYDKVKANESISTVLVLRISQN